MAAEKIPTLKVQRRKLKKTKSFTERLFSLEIKAPKQRSKSGSNSSLAARLKKSSLQNMQVPNANHPHHVSQSSGSKLSVFIHETFDKWTNSSTTRVSRSASSPNMSTDQDIIKLQATNSSPHLTPKSYWRPSLYAIYNHHPLFLALTAFMERSYNSELIFFLQAVHELHTKIDSIICDTDIAIEQKSDEMEINKEIMDIYQLYVSPAAEYQINVSSECFINTSKVCHPQFLSTSKMHQKRKIFDQTVKEVEHLMINSVLSLFYESREFQRIAHKQSPSVSPLSKPAIAPIVLSLSQCTLSVEVPAVVGTISDDVNEDADEFENDEIIFLDQDYFQSAPENV